MICKKIPLPKSGFQSATLPRTPQKVPASLKSPSFFHSGTNSAAEILEYVYVMRGGLEKSCQIFLSAGI